MQLNRIRIVGFRSIADITLDAVAPYSVFAGPNGAGKSNLMDALVFVRTVVEFGAIAAVRQFGGFEQLHCYKFRTKKARTFGFFIDMYLDGQHVVYTMNLHDMDTVPVLEETLYSDGQPVMVRSKGATPFEVNHFPPHMSGLMLVPGRRLHHYLVSIRLFRFDPLGAKEPDVASVNTNELDGLGHNVATMLAALEQNRDIRASIMDWISMLVPGVECVTTERQRLDGRTVVKFKEEGTKAFFPANLISDGTIYALCIMVAILSRAETGGMTLIEEPERGIHPKAITELVSMMRDHATPEHPFFVTTHSESVVRASRPEELWLVNKDDGKTHVQSARGRSSLEGIDLDTAWLMNLFDGGLPW
jgi:predicted ATPase